MKIHITIQDSDEDGLSMGISAAQAQPEQIFGLLIAGAEASVYGHVRQSLIDNGATVEEADYGAPLRARLLTVERALELPMQGYDWVQIDLSRDE